MAFYLWTANYTREAVQAMVKQPQDREAAARKAVEAAGGKLHHIFVALGSADVVVLAEVPDDVSMVAVSLAVGAAGTVTNAATTKLINMSQYVAAMKVAGRIAASYKPPQE